MDYQELHQKKYITTKRITLDTERIHSGKGGGDEERLVRNGNGLSVRKRRAEALYIP